MKKIALTFFAFFAVILPAHASLHLDLTLDIDLNAAQLHVSGHSSAPVTLPSGEKVNGDFSYNWDLPQKQPVENWQGGAFATNNEFYLPANWHPTTDDTLLTYDMRVNAPVVVAAAGKISEESQDDTGYHARFIMVHPIEGIALFGGPYKIDQIIHNQLVLRTYFYEGMQDLSKDYLDRSAQYIDRFSQQIGPYPFAGFNIIAAPVPAGYGFAGATYMGKNVLALPFIKDSSLGHEILHNYWGNGVFPDYPSGNWAEGLTTYMADYMSVERTSADKAKEMRLSWLRDYAALPTEQDKPVNTFMGKHGQASQVIGYHKVAFIFHMLRQELGDEVFFSGLQKFWQDFAFKTASWYDLEQTFKNISNQDLTLFFNQWVQRSGAPEFKSLSARAKRHKGQGWEIIAQVVQGEKFYQTDLPLAIGSGDAVYYKKLPLKGRISHGSLFLSQRPVAASLDPEFNLFRKLAPNEAPPILRDVMLANKVNLIVLNDNLKKSALQLSQRLIDGDVTTSKALGQNTPFLMIGLFAEVQTELQKRQLRPQPALYSDDVTATVWAGKIDKTRPYMIIALKDQASLDQLMRPLPHYGKRNSLQFINNRVVVTSNGQTHSMSVPVH